MKQTITLAEVALKGAHCFAGLLPCAAILIAASAAAAQPICSTPAADVRIELNVPSPSIDNSLPQPALQKLAGKQYHGGRTLGLYRTELKTSFTAHLARQQAGDEVCVTIDRVTLRIAMPQRTIYIIRARQPGTCGYESVLAHERKHEATDETLLAEQIPRLRADIADALAALPPPQPVSIDESVAASAELTKVIATVVKRDTAALFAIRVTRQAQVDSPQEYRRVRAACG